MAKLTAPGAAPPPALPHTSLQQEVADEATVIALKQGAALIKWIPWPHAPEEQWVPIRTCTLPELDAAYAFAHGKCKDLKREGDEKVFERWENLAILSHALRDGVAIQTGIDADGGVVLDYKRQNFDDPLYSTPEHVRSSLRDLGVMNELLGYYWDLTLEAAPLSTYKRLAREGEFAQLAAMLKKKPGPIDLEGFSETQLSAFISFILSSWRPGQDSDTQD
jgi:hypothetical protein